MQEEMNKVTNWLNVNKLSINTTKTKYIIFKSSNKKCDTEINIQLNHNTIQKVTHVKFLGVIIDQNLTWKNHINSVLKNIIKATGTYCRTTTLYKQKYAQINLLCIGLSISCLCMGI
jgi:hypothetical protein